MSVCSVAAPAAAAACAVLDSHSGLAPAGLPTLALLFALPVSSAHLQLAPTAPITVDDVPLKIWCCENILQASMWNLRYILGNVVCSQ